MEEMTTTQPTEITIRPLKVMDVETIAKILAKASKATLVQIAVSLQDKVSVKSILVATVLNLVSEGSDDIVAWLADMAGMTSEELLNAPINTIADVIEAIVKQQGAQGFFKRVSALLSSRLTETLS